MFEVLFVGHIFVINLVYGMFAFEAQTAEKIALKMGPSLPKNAGRVGKGPGSLVTNKQDFKHGAAESPILPRLPCGIPMSNWSIALHG